SLEEGGAVFSGEIPKYGYARTGNPTVATFERKICALEHAKAAVATGSGMGAVSSALLGCLKAGDHVVCSDTVYGCTDVVVRSILPTFGIETTQVDTSNPEAVKAAMKPNTKVLYFEVAANPTMRVTDIAEMVKIGHEGGAKVIVDNTFTPPPVCRPLDFGVDIVLHSVTKYLNGHGDVIAGVVASNDPELIHTIQSKCVGKLCGAAMAPLCAFLIVRGLKTLGLRMKAHAYNATKMAEFLEKQPYIKAVYHPSLPSNGRNYEVAKKQFNEGYTTGMISFETAKKLLNALQIPGIGVSLGGTDSLIQHPASMTHANVTPEGRKEAGITDGMVRFSVGIEDIEDLIADFEQSAAKL
ncbi:MAG: aminotransferase class I/II-fold pyridoxal phosphate-dependent enzyme, partial [Firmicutes bacterium]|nr:aminotransferase class I/II-fold pyridoxal phosphate-dependent enzyme [Bacillota bacterium]